jgi:polyisoprenoid-binding protein YceI
MGALRAPFGSARMRAECPCERNRHARRCNVALSACSGDFMMQDFGNMTSAPTLPDDASTSRAASGRVCAALIIAAGLALAPVAAAAEPVAYRVDPARSAAEFVVTHLAVFHAHGRFARMSGRIVVDAAAQAGSVDLEISAASVSTGWTLRDAFVRGENMFDADRHPVVRFRSNRLAYADGRLARVDGELTLRGVTQPVSAVVTGVACGAGPDARAETCDAEATAAIRRRDFGMDFAWPLIADDVDLFLRIRATRE